jgi:hypothetical protein
MIVAVITLGVTTVVNAAAACLIFMMGQKERSSLLDRIQAPEAARMMNVVQALDNVPTAEEAETLVGINVPWDDDLRILMSEEDN